MFIILKLDLKLLQLLHLLLLHYGYLEKKLSIKGGKIKCREDLNLSIINCEKISWLSIGNVLFLKNNFLALYLSILMEINLNIQTPN